MFSHKKQKSYELRLARVCLASPSLWLKFNPTLNLSAALATVWMLKVKLKKSKYLVVSCADGCHIGNLNESFFIVFLTLETSFYIEQQHFPPPLCVNPRQPHYHVCVFLCCLFCESNNWKKSCSRFHCGDCCSFKCRRKIKMLFLKVNVTNIPE